jgi:hypothetical protein
MEACKKCGSDDAFPFGEFVECQVCGVEFCGKCLEGLAIHEAFGRRCDVNMIVCHECASIADEFRLQIAQAAEECENRIDGIIRAWGEAAVAAGVWTET